ncbi:MAG: exodeoxyribonuclease V subunit gamma [Planctomycetes bacterium]|nr:exodeoxyribonuclease V subunit gamma [Planctomycetota bacterium]
MLHVCLGNDLEDLARAAVDLLEPDPLERALAGATVVVPDRVTGTFVEDVLTRRDGACAGVELVGLDALCARLFAGGASPRRLLDHDALRALLAGVLADPGLAADPDLAAPRDHVAGDPARLGQLAHALARRFLRDDRERPREAPAERWQGALHRAVFGEGGALARLAAATPASPPLRTLGQLVDDDDALAGLALPPRLVAFVGPTLAPVEARLYRRLAGRTEVALFAWTPVAPGGAPGAGPLPAWAAAERARAEALAALADGGRVEARFRPAVGGGLLAALQRALLLGADVDGAPTADGSLTAASFASRRAEVEHAAARVLLLLASDPPGGAPVQLHEVALLVPAGLDAYRPLIASIFGAAGLPVRFLAGAPDDRLVEACVALLDLVGHRCPGRPELTAVLTHPAVLLRAGLARADVVRWLDDLAVHLGLDRAQQAGTYLDAPGPDLYHAASGARRLVLGAFCEGERADEARLVSVAGEPCAPHDVAQDQRVAAARLVVLLRSLAADVRSAGDDRPLGAWGAWLAALVLAYLAPADDDEAGLLARLERRLRRLGLGLEDGAAVPFAAAAACAREVLGDLRRSGSRHLAGGVLVAEALPPLPLRQVQVLGLDEGWPGREVRDGLGPIDPGEAARRAQATLLAALGAAGEVHLSHVDVDDRGDDVPPGPLLEDVDRAVRPCVGVAWRQRPVPPIAAPCPGAALRDDLAAHLGVDPAGSLPPLERLRDEVAPATRAVVDAALGLDGCDVPPAPPGGREDVVEVSVAELKRFLRSPLQETARRAGLREPGEDGADGEPLEVAALDRAVLLREVFVAGWNAALARGRDLDPALAEAHAAMLAREERLGRRVPTRAFLAAARRQQQAVLRAWRLNLRERLDPRERQQPLRHVRLGGVAAPGAPEEVEPALDLPVDLPGETGTRRVTVRVSGRLPLLLGDRSAAVSLGASPGWSEVAFVEGALAHIILAAADLRTGAPFRAFHVCPEWQRAPWKPAALGPLDAAEARAWLADLARDLLVGQWTLLPIEAVLAFQGKGLPSLRQKVLDLRDAERGRASFRYGPLGRLRDFAPPDEATARALAERRLGLYRELRRRAEGAAS